MPILTTVSLAVALAQAPSTVSTSAVAGQVLERSSLLPVAGAEVVLIRDDFRPRAILGSVSTVTDVSGRYSFDSLPPGRYRVDVRTADYAAPIGTAPQVTVAAGEQRTSVNVMLYKAAVIYGRVVAANGEPLPHVDVLALRNAAPNVSPVRRGSVTPVGIGDETNDRGEFRLSRLPPGEYYVQARSQGRIAEPHAGTINTAMLSTYFPSTTNAVSAIPIALAEGETASPVEIQAIIVPAFDISGVVVDEAGQPVANAQVSLSPDDATQPRGPMMGGWHGTRSNTAGEFTLAGVTGGAYVLAAIAPVVLSAPANQTSLELARSRIPGMVSGSVSGGGVTTEFTDGIGVEWRDANGSQMPITVSHAHVTDLVIVVRTPVR